MSLKVELKPGERIILGDCLITNEGGRTKLMIDGKAPLLREKDIMTPEAADTVAKRIYLAVQSMYLSQTPADHHATYFGLVRELIVAAPSTLRIIESINNKILTGSMYKALKDARDLIEYEQELMANAKRSERLL
ncbi:flagellar biosynthesis repressor FlbT [Labrys wisconsinensis]|uniref:Flagellar protein FlbT n=1 Tax=Labrys wisconsinensis TaxID=425677 RepID=A0ABU0JFK2_9HYPH|nr:flagellar biosynthesis repressor FlbT [Labrys wisconsinensis]MDQ0473058.1 flagellar protein FlbT [Labrys wisconsinensis]